MGPHDFTEAHERGRASGPGHPGVQVLHYSGSGIKPWDALFSDKWSDASLLANCAAELPAVVAQLTMEGHGNRLDGYNDVERLWSAICEWLSQFAAMSAALESKG